MRTKKKIKEWSKAATVAAIFAVLFSPIAAADSITHKFKSPSKEEAAALLEAVERDRNNTTLARFIRNLESRVYAQLSRQLVDNLFGETPSTHGTIELEGNTITYASDGDFITLTITDLDANITEISLPIGSFTF